MISPEEYGLYIISDSYFDEFANELFDDNKSEKRPYYYAFRDSSGMIWMIPLSSQTESVKKKISAVEEKRGVGQCIYYHIGKIAGKERAFRISDMFPVTEKYILRHYTISGIPYIVADKKLNNEILSKARKYLSLVDHGAMHDVRNIFEIKEKLLNEE